MNSEITIYIIFSELSQARSYSVCLSFQISISALLHWQLTAPEVQMLRQVNTLTLFPVCIRLWGGWYKGH